VRCTSLDCAWFFQRKKVEKQAEDIEILHELIEGMEIGRESLPESCHDLEPQEDAETSTGLLWDEAHEEPFLYENDYEAAMTE